MVANLLSEQFPEEVSSRQVTLSPGLIPERPHLGSKNCLRKLLWADEKTVPYHFGELQRYFFSMGDLQSYKLCSDVCTCLANFHLRNHPLQVADRNFYLRLLQQYVSRVKEIEARNTAKRQKRADTERAVRTASSLTSSADRRSSLDAMNEEGSTSETSVDGIEAEPLEQHQDPFQE